jgi:predicted nucleotidyltransferase
MFSELNLMPASLFAPSVALANAVLYLNDGVPFSPIEVARAAGIDRSAAQSALATLERRGLARSHDVNGTKVWEPARSSAAADVARHAALADLPWETCLRRAGLEQKVHAIFVHGSAARGELQLGSDIDLLVIGSATASALVRAFEPIEAITRRSIDLAVYSGDDMLSQTGRGADGTRILRSRTVRVFGEWNG